jgi:hypothetical protein
VKQIYIIHIPIVFWVHFRYLFCECLEQCDGHNVTIHFEYDCQYVNCSLEVKDCAIVCSSVCQIVSPLSVNLFLSKSIAILGVFRAVSIITPLLILLPLSFILQYLTIATLSCTGGGGSNAWRWLSAKQRIWKSCANAGRNFTNMGDNVPWTDWDEFWRITWSHWRPEF